MLKKIRVYLTYLSAAVSSLLLLIPLQYTFRYMADSGNPLRQELLVGVMIGSYIALFAWSITALFAYTSRSLLSTRALRILYAPAIVLITLLIIFLLIRIIFSLFMVR